MWAFPYALVLWYQIIPAKLPEQTRLHVSPLELLVGTLQACCSPLALPRVEPRFVVYQLPDHQHEVDRNCITIDRVRYAIPRNVMCSPARALLTVGRWRRSFHHCTQTHNLLTPPFICTRCGRGVPWPRGRLVRLDF